MAKKSKYKQSRFVRVIDHERTQFLLTYTFTNETKQHVITIQFDLFDDRDDNPAPKRMNVLQPFPSKDQALNAMYMATKPQMKQLYKTAVYQMNTDTLKTTTPEEALGEPKVADES